MFTAVSKRLSGASLSSLRRIQKFTPSPENTENKIFGIMDDN
jgi:hypothetical protein